MVSFRMIVFEVVMVVLVFVKVFYLKILLVLYCGDMFYLEIVCWINCFCFVMVGSRKCVFGCCVVILVVVCFIMLLRCLILELWDLGSNRMVGEEFCL